MQYAYISHEEFQSMRENYLERETLKLVKNYPHSIILKNQEDFNHRFIVKSVKATTPNYYALQQLDNGSATVYDYLDEENDTIILPDKKPKFLTVQPEYTPKPNLAQTLYNRIDLETTSVLCPNTQTIFAPNSKDGYLLSGMQGQSRYIN